MGQRPEDGEEGGREEDKDDAKGKEGPGFWIFYLLSKHPGASGAINRT